MNYRRPEIALGIACLVLLFCGCGYGKVEPVTYEYAKALFSICNQKDEARLAEFEQKVESLRANREMSEKEADWLLDIVARAKTGEWEDGMNKCRRMMEDQIDRQ